MRLKDQVAVVTGGGGGIGEGICLCLAREGAHVVVSDVKKDLAEKVSAKVNSTGQKSLAFQTDVRMADQCQALIDTTLKEMGRLDILVCSAGIMGFSARTDTDAPLTIENMLESDWDMTIDVNLKGVFLCNRAVIPHFKKQRKGKIINIASVAGRQGVEFLAPYAASKAGVINLSQSVAMHMAPYNVNVNVVCPGIVWTPMWAEGTQVLSQRSDVFKDADPETIFNAIVETQIPFKRVQTPEDIGNAVVFLASEEAKEVTGQALNVCGGMRFN
ncbi:MAG: SDR family oxidoreductase [Deltaproteobacteria bacterium]|nr:SDR family oxidoreductase [Deltaproteobacteria bacterium]